MNSELAASNNVAGTRQMLTFYLGDEAYGVDILRVREIRGWSPVTRLPHSGRHVLGVLNLRGSIVPIIDLRLRFSLDTAEFTPLTVIIVLSIDTQEGRKECGLVVDRVSDVVALEPDAMRAVPSLSCSVDAEFIQGLASVEDHMMILLDVDELVGRELSAPGAARLTGTG
jgi:purine-binding chemotaxis protein CheW